MLPFSKLLGISSTLIVIVAAQVSGACDPTGEDCPPVSAFGRQVSCDFTKGPCDVVRDRGNLTYGAEKGAELTIEKEDDLPLLVTPRYLFFGKVNFEVRAAAGKGLITTALVQSRSLDEITWTIIGSKGNETETEYFAKGEIDMNDTTKHNTSDTTGSFHNYTIEWTSRAITWSIDGKEVRKLEPDLSDSGDSYPQTPMQVRFGCWAVSRKETPKEIKDWAGGLADMDDAPFKLWIRSLTITDYAGGDKLTEKKVKQYDHKDQSGTYESIKVVEGDWEDQEDENLDVDTDNGSSALNTLVPGVRESPEPTETNTEQSKGGTDEVGDDFAAGAIAGIAVGSAVVVIISVAAGLFMYRRRYRAATNEINMASDQPAKAFQSTAHSGPPPEEMGGVGVMQEMDANKAPVELESPATYQTAAELESPVSSNEPAELETPVNRR